MNIHYYGVDLDGEVSALRSLGVSTAEYDAVRTYTTKAVLPGLRLKAIADVDDGVTDGDIPDNCRIWAHK